MKTEKTRFSSFSPALALSLILCLSVSSLAGCHPASDTDSGQQPLRPLRCHR